MSPTHKVGLFCTKRKFFEHFEEYFFYVLHITISSSQETKFEIDYSTFCTSRGLDDNRLHPKAGGNCRFIQDCYGDAL